MYSDCHLVPVVAANKVPTAEVIQRNGLVSNYSKFFLYGKAPLITTQSLDRN